MKYDGSDSTKAEYTYDNLNRITNRTVTNGASYSTDYTYVSDSTANSTTPLIQSITQGSGANAFNFAYTYDNRGNITSETRNGVTVTYEYDQIGQLIRVNDPNDETAGENGTTWIYAYDRGGNIQSKAAYAYTTGAVGADIRTWVYGYSNENWKDQLTSFDGHTITYDAIGNPLNDGTWTYEWQAGRQLRSMTKTEDGATITMEFTYNHAGLRTKKVKKVNGVIEETTNYIWNGNHVVGLTKGNDVMHFYYDAQGRVSMVKYNGAMYTYVHNLQGDIVGIIDSNGTLIAEYKYDAWGKLISSSLQLVAELNPFRYRHYLFDEETCLYYLINRYYDPNICRFAITDNYIVNNQYSYCINNPIKYDDMDGNRPNSNDNGQGSNSNDLFLEAYKKTYKENYQCTEGYESFEVHIEPEDDRWSKHAKNFMNTLLCSIICTSLQIANQSTQILMGTVIGTAIGDVDIENGNSRHVTVTETSTFTMDIETANIHGYKLYKEEEFERIRISEYLLTDTGYLLFLGSYEATTYDGYLMRNHP